MTNRQPDEPLAAVTPPRHMAHLVASRSYLSYQKSELQDKLKHNPYSYIQVINPDASRRCDIPRGTPPFLTKSGAATRTSRRGWLEAAPNKNGTSTANRRRPSPGLGVVCNLDLAVCANGGLKTHEKTLGIP